MSALSVSVGETCSLQATALTGLVSECLEELDNDVLTEVTIDCKTKITPSLSTMQGPSISKGTFECEAAAAALSFAALSYASPQAPITSSAVTCGADGFFEVNTVDCDTVTSLLSSALTAHIRGEFASCSRPVTTTTTSIIFPDGICSKLDSSSSQAVFDGELSAQIGSVCNKAGGKCTMLNASHTCGSILSTVVFEFLPPEFDALGVLQSAAQAGEISFTVTLPQYPWINPWSVNASDTLPAVLKFAYLLSGETLSVLQADNETIPVLTKELTGLFTPALTGGYIPLVTGVDISSGPSGTVLLTFEIPVSEPLQYVQVQRSVAQLSHKIATGSVTIKSLELSELLQFPEGGNDGENITTTDSGALIAGIVLAALAIVVSAVLLVRYQRSRPKLATDGFVAGSIVSLDRVSFGSRDTGYLDIRDSSKLPSRGPPSLASTSVHSIMAQQIGHYYPRGSITGDIVGVVGDMSRQKSQVGSYGQQSSFQFPSGASRQSMAQKPSQLPQSGFKWGQEPFTSRRASLAGLPTPLAIPKKRSEARTRMSGFRGKSERLVPSPEEPSQLFANGFKEGLFSTGQSPYFDPAASESKGKSLDFTTVGTIPDEVDTSGFNLTTEVLERW